MKSSLLSLLLAVAGQVSLAQGTVPGEVPGGTVSARDGFTKSGTSVLLTRNGVSQKVDKEILLENGLRVQGDGSVTLPSGEKASLRNNQLLTMSGTFEEVALSPQGTAPVSSVVTPMKRVGEEVGLSSTEWVTVSSGAALVTRNGVTEQLKQELALPNGTKVKPDGTVTFADGKQITLSADQVLSFDGRLRETTEPLIPAPPSGRDGGIATPGANPATTSPR